MLKNVVNYLIYSIYIFYNLIPFIILPWQR